MRKIRRIFFILICFCLLVGSAADLIPRAYAASSMTASEHCVEFIKKVEGFSAKPYYDYSQYTVGYGTKCPDEKYSDYMANGISRAEAEELLREEIQNVEDGLNKRLLDKYDLTLNQQQFDALVSFSYNIGTGWTTYDSTLRNAILRDASDSEFVYAFGLYCTAGGKYLPGLITRRLCEANIFLNGIYSQKLSDDYGYVYYDANGGSLTYRVQGFISDNNTTPAADAKRNHAAFIGWYTELNGGSQITTLSKALTGKTLFARWESTEDTEDQTSSSTTVKVTGDVVNIRSGPGTNYGIVKQIYQNEILTVSHVTHLTNMKWGKVPSGWICLDYTNYDTVINGAGNSDVEGNDPPSDEVTVPDNNVTENEPDMDTDMDVSTGNQNIETGIVNVNDFLNIRSGPGTTYSTVGFLFKDTKVSILEQRSAGTTVWGRIEKGWVCMDYILTGNETNNSGTAQTPEKAPVQETPGSDNNGEAVSIKGKITADALRIRSGAGTTYSIVGFYYQNERVVISERVLVGSVYWGKTSKGWISMEYVLADSTNADSSQPIEDEKKTVIGDCLRIRKDAGTNHKIVGFLYYGDRVAISETKDVDGTLWGKVDKGWICMQYVT